MIKNPAPQPAVPIQQKSKTWSKVLYFLIFLLLVGLIGSLILNSTSVAALEVESEASDSAQEADESSVDETTLELKKRIEKVVEEKREQVKGVIQDLLSGKSGYIGEVARVSEETITITTAEGNVVVPIGNQVQILKDDKALMLEKIEVGNWVIILGNSEAETVVPDYIFVEEKSLRTPTQVVALGTLQTADKNKVVITTRGSGEEKTFTVVKTSTFEDRDGEEAVIADFEEEISVIVTGFATDDGIELSTLRSLASLSDMNE